MISIKIFICNAFQENTYLVFDETGQTLVVDAGNSLAEEDSMIEAFIHSNQLTPMLLVSTHGHVDHLLGNAFLKEKYHLPYAAHADDLDLIKDAASHGAMFGLVVKPPPLPDRLLSHGDVITFGNSLLRVIHLPGHSKGGIGLYSEKQHFIIVGDVLFQRSIGRTDLPGGDFDQLVDSIRSQLFTLPEETVVYPGHGPSTTIYEEIHENPFLK